MYGFATNLVYSSGKGVHCFTLDHALCEFVLTRSKITMPQKGRIYSINEGNAERWAPYTKDFVGELKSKRNRYSLRYVGTMVADMHRTLLRGGIFMYPGDELSPNGKLRLVYEASPFAWLAKQAGGCAVTVTT